MRNIICDLLLPLSQSAIGIVGDFTRPLVEMTEPSGETMMREGMPVTPYLE